MSGYGTFRYGAGGYGGSTGLVTFPGVTVIPPAAAATASMTAPTVVLGIRVAAPAAAATASMTPPLVRQTPLFTAYNLDDNSSQALQVTITMSATLEVDVIPVDPPSHYTEPQVRARRLSFVMPTPSLDSRGRPA